MKPTLKNLLVGVAAGLASCEYRPGGTVSGKVCLSSEVFLPELLPRFLLRALVHSSVALPGGETGSDSWVFECVESFLDPLEPCLRDIELVEHPDIVFRSQPGEAWRSKESPWRDDLAGKVSAALDSIAKENFVLPADSWGIGYDPVLLRESKLPWLGQALGRQILDWRRDSVMRICKGLMSNSSGTPSLLVYLHKDPFSQAVA